ncbi:MAG TPA: hypothetical protein VLQ29_00250 [Candidatus Dormibacteraeota bacterium]|nr:hypothetical protein [Candidatus Dormibacteraeota bacterium]
MRLLLISLCLSLTTLTLTAMGREFSHSHELPPLRLGAADLDAILLKTHSFIDASNGPSGEQDSGRESVKLVIGGHEIEIPHFSLASSVAFPKEVFRFSYTYYRPGKPISSVTLDFSDYSRRVTVSGETADQVEAITNLLEKDLLRFSTEIGGASFRRLSGVLLSVVFLTFLGLGGAWWWRTRAYSAYGILICSAVGLSLVLLVPWDRYLPGFVLYQSYSRFLLPRYAPQIFFFSLVATLAGIPLSYFLFRSRWRA